MKFRTIRSLTDKIATWDPSKASSGEQFTYVDLGSVDQQEKKIIGVTLVYPSEAPSRARQLVKTGDVLVSTVRPNLNGVALVSEGMNGATASTGFCILRPTRELDSSYLFHWVRSPLFIAEMTRRATGQSYPAVSDRLVKDSFIPSPDVRAQRRIAEVLDSVDALRSKRRKAIALLDDLAQSIFLEMFGDPVSNFKGWPMVRLTKLGSLDRGVSKHRPRNAPELLGGKYPLIQTGDVATSQGYITEWKATYSDIGLAQSKLWPSGTLCITIAANIARTGILNFDACFPDSVVGFSSTPDIVEYVQVWLSFHQENLEHLAPESAQKNINLAVLRGLNIPNPGSSLISSFAERIRAANTLKAAIRSHLAELDALFASLQCRAFRGELWVDSPAA